MVVDLSDAVVVHVPAISHDICVSEGGNFGPGNICDSSCKTLILHSNVFFCQSDEGI